MATWLSLYSAGTPAPSAITRPAPDAPQTSFWPIGSALPAAVGMRRNVLSPWLIAEASTSISTWPGAAAVGVGISRTSSSRPGDTQIALIAQFLVSALLLAQPLT